MTMHISYLTKRVGDVDVFYRSAGDAAKPTFLLLHGFPSSGHQFRNLIPMLANDYHVIAPDLPGFGSTLAPPRGRFDYTFANLAETIDGFVTALGLERFAVYVFDYGAPVGFRLATRRPERITAIISQNGNAYEEGLTDAWSTARALWTVPSRATREALLPFLARESTEWQYFEGVPEDRRRFVSPDSIAHDQAILDRDPELQIDLIRDYETNVAAYPAWQSYLREYRPPLLAIWGRNDPFFAPAGAEAYRRDLPDAEIEFLDTGHFALETHAVEIAARIRAFLAKVL